MSPPYSMALPKREDYLSDVWRDGIFTNKIVFCTGGAGTICSGQVRALVALGANACIVGRNVEKTERVASQIAKARDGARVLGFGSVDVRSFESLKKVADKCVEELGGIDIVIAGAAGNFLSPMTALSPNAFKSVIDIDLIGSYNTVKATLPHLIRSASSSDPDKRGNSITRIIFVSATIHYTGAPLQTHVSAAKAGVDALSASCALEFGPRGITSNVIAPGPIAGTEGMDRLARKEDVGAAGKAIPLGRFGTVREIADATVFICSPTGSYVNGSVVVVDGGAWRLSGLGIAGSGFPYPEFLLGDGSVTGVGGLKKQEKTSKL